MSGCGEPMPYLNQVDALIHEARRLLAHAEQEAGNWPLCGHLLARALEHATCAVFMAWGEPYAPEKKMHQVFYERMVPHVDPAIPLRVAGPRHRQAGQRLRPVLHLPE